MKYGKFLQNNYVVRYKNHYIKYNSIKEKISYIKNNITSNNSIKFNYLLENIKHTSILDIDTSINNDIFIDLQNLLDYVNNEGLRIIEVIEKQFDNISLLLIEVNNKIYNINNKIINYIDIEKQIDEIVEIILDLELFILHNYQGYQKILKKIDKHFNTKTTESYKNTTNKIISMNNKFNKFVVSISDFYYHINNYNVNNNMDDTKPIWNPPSSFERNTKKYWIKNSDLLKFKFHISKYIPVLVFGKSNGIKTNINQHNKTIKKKFDEDSSWITSIYFDNDELESCNNRLQQLEGAELFRIRWYGNNIYESQLFFERKTHHESWVVENSVKERFNIKYQDIYPFITNNLDIDNPLALEFKTQINCRKLHPLIRTCYKRCAFQNNDNNDIRITIDSNLLLLKEHFTLENNTWHIDNQDSIHLENIYNFPYSIVEIKLQKEPPDYLIDIMSYLTEVYKFSKFGCACCLFYPEKIYQFPVWFNNINSQQEIINKIEINTANIDNIHIDNNMTTNHTINDSDNISNIDNNSTNITISMPEIKNNKPIEYKKPVKIEPKTFFANERTFIQWLSASLLITTLSFALIGFNTETSKISGLIMFPVAVIFIVYSLIIYLLRINSIKNRDTQNYIDIYGPIALVSILIISMICTIIFTYYHYNHQNNISNHLPEIDDGFYCQQILIPIIKPIFNQFSGIMYHNNTFFIVSSYKLIIYNILDNLIRFISIPNYDIEDITINPYQNNSVLLIAEDTLHNHFINVDYHNYNYSLIYTLSKKHTAESITYDNNTNSFYIGDDNGKITNIKFIDGDIIKYSNIDNKYINQYINITQKKNFILVI